MNRDAFYTHLSTIFYKGKPISEYRKACIDFNFNAFDDYGITNKWQKAYILATAYHETAHTFEPIEEYGKGKGHSYGKPAPNGLIYYGRGHVQLTWDHNYKSAGEKLGLPLYEDPELALHPEIAAGILVLGMRDGWFTGRGLSRYINDRFVDLINARRIVNGTDRADMIKKYAELIYTILE